MTNRTSIDIRHRPSVKTAPLRFSKRRNVLRIRPLGENVAQNGWRRSRPWDADHFIYHSKCSLNSSSVFRLQGDGRICEVLIG
ncbi:hypothetical protein JTE90_014093 [Oedothorax gibbosus]|uniref:Uncharacterized protein n=1 Tax=Oedothorax gibbosus TaxID=931172 RepID=A0AAV6V8E9_9ARAC|nr:hypothetical protein JTE90_014093 [Oedothorax gibbosus]